MSEGELKPCPFCGGEAESRIIYGGKREKAMFHYVRCSKCFAQTFSFPYKNTDRTGVDPAEEAIKAWNRRSDMAPRIIETFDGYKIRQLEGIRDILRNRKIRPEDLNNFWKAFQLGVDTCQKQLLSINEDVSEEIGRNIQLLLKIGKKEDE